MFLDPTNNGDDLDNQVGSSIDSDYDGNDDSGHDTSFSRPGASARPGNVGTNLRPTQSHSGSGTRPGGNKHDFDDSGSINHSNKPPFNTNLNNNNSNSNNRNKFNSNRIKPNRDRNESTGDSSGSGYDGTDHNNDADRDGPGSGSGSVNDWRKRPRQSTLIKNVGSWYVGLPPGVAVRAHVQNIDLLPAGQGAESPGNAAKREDRARHLKFFWSHSAQNSIFFLYTKSNHESCTH